MGILGDIVGLYPRFALLPPRCYQHDPSLLTLHRELYNVFAYDYAEKKGYEGKAAREENRGCPLAKCSSRFKLEILRAGQATSLIFDSRVRVRS